MSKNEHHTSAYEKAKLLNLFEIDDILTNPKSASEYSRKLRLTSGYMHEAAECILPELVEVVDPWRLLVRFEEIFLAGLRMVREFSEEYSARIAGIETKLDLSQMVTKLGTVARDELPPQKGIFDYAFQAIKGARFQGLGLSFSFPERQDVSIGTSMLEIKTALHRLAGLFGASAGIAERWWHDSESVVTVEGFYDPRRVDKASVVGLITKALSALTDAPDVPREAKRVLTRELQAAIKELECPSTPWSRVLSRLTQATMVLATTVTIVGGVTDASENLKAAFHHTKEAIQTIQQQAVSYGTMFTSKVQPLLPAPTDPDQHSARAPEYPLGRDPDDDLLGS